MDHEELLYKIEERYDHHMGILHESFQHKLDLVVEGYQMLSEKLDRVKKELEDRIGCVEHKLDTIAAKGDATAAKLDGIAIKLDAVAVDLAAHRADTEVHKKVYKVREGE